MFKEVKGYFPLEVTREGVVRNSVTGNVLKNRKERDGYWRARGKYKGNVTIGLVHRLIAIAYIPNPENKPQVNHINSDRGDFRICNLEWVTASENRIHANLFGRGLEGVRRGEDNNLNTIPEKTIREICVRLVRGDRAIDISRDTGVTQGVVSDVKVGRKWKHVSSEYFKDASSLPPRSHLLSDQTIIWICKQLNAGKGYPEIVKSCTSKIKYPQVRNIHIRKSYTHISKDYLK